MAKTFEEYLKDAEKAGLLGAPQAAPQANPFGNLDNVTYKSEGTPGEFNLFHTAIDLISRPEFAVTNTILGINERGAESADRAARGEDTSFDGIAGVGGAFADFWKGLTSTDPEEHPYGAELIQNISDINNRHDPNYDPESVNDVAKGVGGLALDIALDPLTYLTGGIAKVAGLAGRGIKSATAGVKAGAEAVGEGATVADKAAVHAADAQKAFSDRVSAVLDDIEPTLAEDAATIPAPATRDSAWRSPEPPAQAFGEAASPVSTAEKKSVTDLLLSPEGRAASPDGAKIVEQRLAEQAREAAGIVGTTSAGSAAAKAAPEPPLAPPMPPAAAVVPPTAPESVAEAIVGKQAAEAPLEAPLPPPSSVAEVAEVVAEAPTVAPTIDDALRVLKGVGEQIKTGKAAPKIKAALTEMRTAREHGVLVKTAVASERDIPMVAWFRANINKVVEGPSGARTLGEWNQRKNGKGANGNTLSREQRDAARDVIAAEYQKTPEGAAAFAETAAATMRSGEGFADYVHTVQALEHGGKWFADVFPPATAKLLKDAFENDPKKAEQYLSDLVRAFGRSPNGRWLINAAPKLKVALLGDLVDTKTRKATISTVSQIIEMDWLTHEGQRLGTTAEVWNRAAKEHVDKAAKAPHIGGNGVNKTTPAYGEGTAIFVDEVNMMTQWSRSKWIDKLYLSKVRVKNPNKYQKEFLDFVAARRTAANPGKFRNAPATTEKLFGRERARMRMEFKAMKLRELDEIDDVYGFRSKLDIGPLHETGPAALGVDRVALSMGDIYTIINNVIKESPELEDAALLALEHYPTAVAPTQLLRAIQIRLQGGSVELAREELLATRMPGAKGSKDAKITNNLANSEGWKDEYSRPWHAGFHKVGEKGEEFGSGPYPTHTTEELLAGLEAVLEKALPALQSKALENERIFAARPLNEANALTTSQLTRLQELVQKGDTGELLHEILDRRLAMKRTSDEHHMTQAGTNLALETQENLITVGGHNLIDDADRLAPVKAAVDEHLGPESVPMKDASGAPHEHPTPQEIVAAVNSLQKQGHAYALERHELIRRRGSRQAAKDMNNPDFRAEVYRLRREKEAKAAKLSAEEAALKVATPEPLTTAKPTKTVAAEQHVAAQKTDNVTQKAHISEDEALLKEAQQAHQLHQETLAAELPALEAELAAGGARAEAAAARAGEMAEELTAANFVISAPMTAERTDQLTGRLLNPLRIMFDQSHNMKGLHPRLFKNVQHSQNYTASKLRELIKIREFVRVHAAELGGPKLAEAFSNLQHGIVQGGKVGEISKMMESYLADILPARGADPMASNLFRNTQNVELLNEMLARNGLRGSDIGVGDQAIFDWERAVEQAKATGDTPYNALMEQWKSWKVEDPLRVLGALAQTAGEVAQRRAVLADFRTVAVKEGWASTTPKPGFVKVTAGSGETKLGGFLDEMFGKDGAFNAGKEQLYFDKTWAKELQVADAYMKAPKYIHNRLMRDYYMPLLNWWKYAVTMPRPGHHIRNEIGDLSIQTMFRGVRFLRQSQVDAARIMSQFKAYEGVNIQEALKRTMDGAGAATEVGTGEKMIKGTKLGDFTIDELYHATEEQALYPSYMAKEALFDEPASQASFAQFLNNTNIVKNSKLGDKLGDFSEWRSHNANVRHFMQFVRQEANSGKYKTREELFAAAGREARRAHPDANMLTPNERYMKAIFPFYTWFKGIMPAIVETSMLHPNRLMWAPKGSLNLAVANGINPESFSNPYPDDQLFPSFITSQMLGPQFKIDDKYVGFNPGIANLDVFNTFSHDPVRGVLGMTSPIFRVPAELAGNSKWATGQPIKDLSDYLDTNIPGVNYVANMTGYSPSSILTDGGLQQQEQVERGVRDGFDQGLSFSNWFSGLSGQNLSKENYQTLATIEKRDRALKESQSGQ